jgi:hypothetical protein
LIDRGVIFEPDSGIGAFTSTPEWRSAIHDMRVAMKAAADNRIEDALDAYTRAVAIRLRDSQHINAVAVTSSWEPLAQPCAPNEVLRLVISALPVPAETHALHDILAFRDHANGDGLTQGLRVWINEMASGKLTPVEVSDKLEDLVSRYDRALTLEKMSRSTGVVETLVVTTAEIAESLVKFQWSKLAKKLFEVRHRQIDLMKAEMTLRGREVAYIVKARERLGEV